MGQRNDWYFMNYVQRELRTGTKKVRIPAELLECVSKEAMKEVNALVKISGAEIVSVDVTY